MEIKNKRRYMDLMTIWNKRGDDEEVITNDELSNPGDENLIEENEIAQIFRIDIDIFHFETPLCKAFKEFNYLLKIDVDVLTNDIHGFMAYDEYKDEWIYQWNNGIPWVAEKPWSENGEPIDDIDHVCKPFCFKIGHAQWPIYNWKEEGCCNRGDLSGIIPINTIHFQDYEWYKGLEDGKLKEESLKEKSHLRRITGP
ncbi:hypothetical protein Tco_0625026 [Tanacetum coccineum]|uniref:Uncharacterized protein n=1 Tax=Tanacetum coccineum TaxID=301880 RepID=A0ABQ4WFM9_9ASTR